MPDTLPRLKKDRTPETFYRTAKYLRYWDGTDLLCEHKEPPPKCATCKLSSPNQIIPSVNRLVPTPITIPVATPAPLANGWPALILPHKEVVIIPGLRNNDVGSKYRVSHKIGSGSFGVVYEGANIQSNERVAIKIEAIDAKYPQLVTEYNTYSKLPPGIGIPKVHWLGSNKHIRIMVMDLLGPNLETMFTNAGRKFNLSAIIDLGIQMISRVEYYHANGLLHRDIKPDNFVLGAPHGSNSSVLYLVDLGLARKYSDENRAHIPHRENLKCVGTLRYMSLNVHLGVEPSRRDDMESIGLILLYFLHGRLPWQGMKSKTNEEKVVKIREKHASTTIEMLCTGSPVSFAEYLRYCRTMRFEQKPDYAYLRRLLKGAVALS
jgi:serine/threonine protein kinase